MAESGGANLLKKYFYGKKLKSYGAPLKSGGAAALKPHPFHHPC